jgi:hypothetical protein
LARLDLRKNNWNPEKDAECRVHYYLHQLSTLEQHEKSHLNEDTKAQKAKPKRFKVEP